MSESQDNRQMYSQKHLLHSFQTDEGNLIVSKTSNATEIHDEGMWMQSDTWFDPKEIR